MSRFLRVLLAFTVLSHLAPAVGVAEGARRAHMPWPWAFGVALLVGGVGLFLGRARVGVSDFRRHPLAVALVDMPYYVHWCACLLSFVPSLVALLVLPLVDLIRGAPATLPRGAFLWIYVTGLVLSTYGVLIRRRAFVVRRVEVPVDGLPQAFDGYRIAHLSDLHIGAHTPKTWGLRWTRAANALDPHLTVVTGDMVTSGTVFHDEIAQVVSTLRAPDGVVVSMGNHDYFGEGEPLISLLHEVGARVLRNEGTFLEREGERVYLAAIDDTWTRRADMDRALAGRPEGMSTVLLAHDPDQFRAAAKREVDVVLSGHTHGGQVAMPFLARHITPSKLSHEYHLGLYRRGRSTLYVHPGLGTTGPPIRIGVAPAVVLITLRAV